MNTENPSLSENEPKSRLDRARKRVVEIPGFKDYLDGEGADEEVEALSVAISELTSEIDAQNMVKFITHSFAMSEEESDEFFSHPERKPYKSGVELSSDWEKRREEYIDIGRYLKLLYQEIKVTGRDPEVVEQAASNLRILYEYSLLELFEEDYYQIEDRVNGVEPESRKKGDIKPSEEFLSLVKEEAVKVAREAGVDGDELYDEVVRVSGGGILPLATNYLFNKKGSSELRRTFELIWKRRMEDEDLTKEKLNILWRTIDFSMRMGVDLETYYEIIDLPEGAVIEKQLREFLTREDLVNEMRRHLENEAKQAVEAAEKESRPISFWKMLEERAVHLELPDGVESRGELEEKKEEFFGRVGTLFPLSSIKVPASFIDAPTRVGARTRAVNVTYANEKERQVNVVILNAREERRRFVEMLGHEVGHKIHAHVLQRAEEAGLVPDRAWEKLPSPVKEEFSQLLEDRVAKMLVKKERVSQPTVGKEWRNLMNAFISRRQAPYAITQRRARLMLEEMWVEGKRTKDLTQEELSELRSNLEPLIESWYSMGVDIDFPAHRLLNNVNVIDPGDGLVYLRKYLSKGEERPVDVESESESADMGQAFIEKFGEDWIEKKGARAVLYSLMIESARNYDITTYSEFIDEEDIEEAYKKLISIGIDRELI